MTFDPNFRITASLAQPPHAFFDGLVASRAGIGFEVVQIADRWYLLDLESDRYRVRSIPAFRPQEDTSTRPGEQTLSNSGLWRRHVSSWHLGAGQVWYDRDDGDPFRFRASKGVDPFTQWQLTLLPDTDQIVEETAGWTSMAVADFTGGVRLVVAGGAGRCVTIEADETINEVTGLTGEVWCTSTGGQAYVSDDTGIYPLDAAGTGLGTALNTNITGAKIWFAKDRIWAADGANLYNVIDSTTTDPHFTHNWPGWEWTGVHEGNEFVYACGFSGDRGQVYSIGITENATDPEVPVVALRLPDGETAHSVHGYVGFVAVGTNLGLRVCQPDGPSLVSGALVGVPEDGSPHPVRAIEGHDNFLWFGQDQLFPDDSGLGRVDLRNFVSDLAPAYATDLMSGVSNDVFAVMTFDSRRWFVVGNDVYREDDSLVFTGHFDTGRITMNLTDHKVAVYADLRHEALPAGTDAEMWVRTPTLDFMHRGTSEIPGTIRPPDVFNTHHARTLWHEMRVVLNRSPGASESPVLTAATIAAEPVPDRSFNLFLPLILNETVSYVDQEFSYDVEEEFTFLSGLSQTQQLIRVRHGALTFLAFVEDFDWVPHMPRQDGKFFNGTMVLQLKTAEVER